MYEVGIANTLGKPVIFLTQNAAGEIPFDLKHYKYISYSIDEKGWAKKARAALTKNITETIEELNKGSNRWQVFPRLVECNTLDDEATINLFRIYLDAVLFRVSQKNGRPIVIS